MNIRPCLASCASLALVWSVRGHAQCADWLPPTHSTLSGSITASASCDFGLGSELIVGGTFTSIDGVSASRIARWNGVSWSPLGGGLSQSPDALAQFIGANGPELFASSTVGTALHLQRWDGATWSSVGVDGASPGHIFTMRTFDDGSGPALYVGGDFSVIAGIAANNVARWDGATWTAVGAGPDYPVRDFEAFDDGQGFDLYVAGADDDDNGHVERWDGVQWQVVGYPDGSGDHALAVFDSGAGLRLHKAGTGSGHGFVSAVSVWDGTVWTLVSPLWTGGYIRTLVAFDIGQGPQLAAGGSFDSPPQPHLRILGANGTWSAAVPGGASPNGNVLTLVQHDDGRAPALWIGGSFSSIGTVVRPALAALRGCADSPPINFCTSGTSVASCAPVLSSSGSPRVLGSGAPFVVTMSQLDGQRSAGSFYGINGPHSGAWGNGYLCARAPLQRLALGFGGGTAGACDGQLSIDLSQYAATHPGALGQPYAAGTTLWMQGWVRDPANTSGRTTVHSDGLRFTWWP